MFDPREKIALFIDGANLFAASKSLGFEIDYGKLLIAFRNRGYLLRAYYYTALIGNPDCSSIRPLIDWLDYNGYSVVTKPAKEFTDSLGRRKIKGNMDIELAIDAMEQSQTVDHLVIFSGDGDFTTLVEALQRKGRKVSVVSTMATQPPMIADELRRQADHFIDLITLRGEIDRHPPQHGQPVTKPVSDEIGVGADTEPNGKLLPQSTCQVLEPVLIAVSGLEPIGMDVEKATRSVPPHVEEGCIHFRVDSSSRSEPSE